MKLNMLKGWLDLEQIPNQKVSDFTSLEVWDDVWGDIIPDYHGDGHVLNEYRMQLKTDKNEKFEAAIRLEHMTSETCVFRMVHPTLPPEHLVILFRSFLSELEDSDSYVIEFVTKQIQLHMHQVAEPLETALLKRRIETAGATFLLDFETLYYEFVDYMQQVHTADFRNPLQTQKSIVDSVHVGYNEVCSEVRKIRSEQYLGAHAKTFLEALDYMDTQLEHAISRTSYALFVGEYSADFVLEFRVLLSRMNGLLVGALKNFGEFKKIYY